MMEDTDELKDNPDHLNEGHLIDYHSGRLDETELEKAEYHLLHCDECLSLLNDVRDFFGSIRDDERPIDYHGLKREWSVFWNRVEERGTKQYLAAGQRPHRIRLSPVLVCVLAGLFVVLAATAVWVIKLRQANSFLTRQFEIEQKDAADRVSELEQENLNLQERARILEQTPQPDQNTASQRVEVQPPALNVPIYDLYSVESIRRSAEKEQANRIKLPSAARSFVLILNGENQSDYPEYAIEIVNPKGRVWSGKGLRRDKYGNFSLSMSSALLGTGTYHLKLYGQRNRVSSLVAEYLLRIE
jgi:hypothetical protein